MSLGPHCIPLRAAGLYDHLHQHKATDLITQPDCHTGHIMVKSAVLDNNLKA